MPPASVRLMKPPRGTSITTSSSLGSALRSGPVPPGECCSTILASRHARAADSVRARYSTAMLSFLVVASGLWSVLHVYVAWRVIAPLSVRGFRRKLLYALFVPGVLLAPLVFAADILFAP